MGEMEAGNRAETAKKHVEEQHNLWVAIATGAGTTSLRSPDERQEEAEVIKSNNDFLFFVSSPQTTAEVVWFSDPTSDSTQTGSVKP